MHSLRTSPPGGFSHSVLTSPYGGMTSWPSPSLLIKTISSLWPCVRTPRSSCCGRPEVADQSARSPEAWWCRWAGTRLWKCRWWSALSVLCCLPPLPSSSQVTALDDRNRSRNDRGECACGQHDATWKLNTQFYFDVFAAVLYLVHSVLKELYRSQGMLCPAGIYEYGLCSKRLSWYYIEFAKPSWLAISRIEL